MEFPDRVYTEDEVKKAKNLVKNGYKHEINIQGEDQFTRKVNKALDLIKTAGFFDLVRSYIRLIKEIDGLTQLRETEVAIWANKFAVENPVDFASLLIQKVHHMKEYLEGDLYYGGQAEKRTIQKRIEFLELLKNKSDDVNIKEECNRLLEMWRESSLAY